MAQRKGPMKGTGGHGRRRLQGKGATPPAQQRPGHPAARRAAAAQRRTGPSARAGERADVVAGRNPVVEALRAGVPGKALYVLSGVDADARVAESVRVAAGRGVPLLEVARPELDRLAGGASHQGLVLLVPPYSYEDPDALLARALEAPEPLLVAVDGVTDPRNLGAIVRSAAAFGAQGVLVPERRAAGVTAAAWRSSAGAVARLPVARVTNLVRSLKAAAAGGFLVVGLTADGELDLDEFAAADSPLVLVVGSEGRGLSRLVGETCDLRLRIAMSAGSESLNASVAAGVALATLARLRRGS